MFTVVGTTTLDVLVTAPEDIPGQEGDEFTTENLMFCGEPLRLLPGGNGANSAYVLASLGAPTVLCSAVGNDVPGRLLQNWLEEAGVNLSDVVEHPEKATSSTTVISDEHNNRQAFHHHGSSGTFGPENLSRRPASRDDVLLLTGYPLLVRWRSRDTIPLLEDARSADVVTALDIGPAIGKPVMLDELRPLLPHLDYLLCNAHEAFVCTESNTIENSSRKLRRAGARTVIIKRGPEGAAYLADGASSLKNVDGFSVDAQQTVGAGDSFNAGFLYARQHGYSLREGILFAHAVAALVVASGRGVLGCPTRGQIQELLMQQP